MGNAIIKCVQCNPVPVEDKKTRDTIEACIVNYEAKKKEKQVKKNMKRILKSL